MKTISKSHDSDALRDSDESDDESYGWLSIDDESQRIEYFQTRFDCKDSELVKLKLEIYENVNPEELLDSFR